MNAERTRHQLESVLRQEAECTDSLRKALEAERSALVQRDVDALESAIQEKITHTQALEKLDGQRQEMVSGMGFASDAQGMMRCLVSLPGSAGLTRLWQKVLRNIRECQTDNLTNGGILESGRHQVEQALRILRGQQGSPTLYTPHGETPANLGRRDLGKV